MNVRLAGPGDDIKVSALIADYAAAYAFELGDQDVVAEGLNARDMYEAGALLVAEVDGDIVGCVAYEPWGEGRARMKRLFVLEESRGKGIGLALAEAVVEEAKKAGHKTMVLDTTQGMAAARAMYAKMGFEEWTPDYEAPCRDAVYMRRSLVD